MKQTGAAKAASSDSAAPRATVEHNFPPVSDCLGVNRAEVSPVAVTPGTWAEREGLRGVVLLELSGRDYGAIAGTTLELSPGGAYQLAAQLLLAAGNFAAWPPIEPALAPELSGLPSLAGAWTCYRCGFKGFWSGGPHDCEGYADENGAAA